MWPRGFDTDGRAPLDAFSDGDQTSDWAQDAMSWAVKAGMFKGNVDGTLNPRGSATRAEVAVLLWRFAALETSSERETPGT